MAILPTHKAPYSPPPPPRRNSFLSSRSIRQFYRERRTPVLIGLVITFLLLLVNARRINTARRDLGYLLRPIWDRPPTPFEVITHYPSPAPIGTNASWCASHGWSARSTRPVVVDAIPISTELDMLELRIREYAGYVDFFLIVESAMTFAGTPKPLHFAENWSRFEALADKAGAKIVYTKVDGFEANLPKGSFANEVKQRQTVTGLITEQRRAGRIPAGSLVIMSDVDEIISRDTLALLTACEGYPEELHLQVRNYRYSFAQPLRDGGYWRPHVTTVPSDANAQVVYHHGRSGNVMLADAGWHCTFCFPTLEDMRVKMRGYSHNDRATGVALEEAALRKKVCSGQDPFGMWPEEYTFKDIIAQSGPITPAQSFRDVPRALTENPARFPYLLDKGCERPDK